MNAARLLAFVASLMLTVPLLQAQSTNMPRTQAEQLCAAYAAIRTVSCEIRKTTSGGEGPAVRILSRVYYQKPDRVHIDNVSPTRRRIIADGQSLYYHEQHMPRGFSRPIDQLSETWMASLRNIPGTPYEHLVRLQGIPEQRLDTKPDGPRRFGYDAGKMYVILSLDGDNRPVLIEFFSDAGATSKKAEYRYGEFAGPFDGCWFPNLHKGLIHLPDNRQVRETRRISSLQVNTAIAQGLFNPDTFFKGVEFTDDFRATYE